MASLCSEYLSEKKDYFKRQTKALSKERKRLLAEIQSSIGVKFSNLNLLDKALTHKSWANERTNKTRVLHNQRLELFGDNILAFIVCEYLFCRFPALSEGELSKIKSAVVSKKSLAAVATSLKLGHYLRLGRGEARNGARQTASILEDSLESLIGAVYLDKGIQVCRKFVLKYFNSVINDTAARSHMLNYKSILQECMQKKFRMLPTYKLDKTEGPDNRKYFYVSVFADKELLGKGSGYSKREAESVCAFNALNKKFKREFLERRI